jgi:hypothetical protein
MYEWEQVTEEEKHHWEHEEGSIAGHFGRFIAYSVEDATQEQSYDYMSDQPKLRQVLQQNNSKMVYIPLTEFTHSFINVSTAFCCALAAFFLFRYPVKSR